MMGGREGSGGLDTGLQDVTGCWTCLLLWDASPPWEVEGSALSCQAGGENTPA